MGNAKQDWELARRAYVADFGAGNTCMYVTNPDAKVPDVVDITDPNGEPSGYALWKNRTTELGLGLYGLGTKDLDQIHDFHINLKALPSKETQEELTFYFRSWLEKVKRGRHQEFDGIEKAYWFIGCPTNDEWKKTSTRNLYQKIFERAGFENVTIVPESNAAMAYYAKSQGLNKKYGENKRILLIDQGAYSLDGTYYGDKTVSSFGSCLGASLIERMILRMILYNNEENLRLKKRIINYDEPRQEVRAQYERDGAKGKFKTYLLLQTRRLKEDYFTAQNDNTLLQNRDLTLETDFESEDDDGFTLFVNHVMMNRILEETPVSDILAEEFQDLPPEVQTELRGLTWMQAFRNFLERLSENFGGLGSGKNLLIMLTGGGSLMRCVSDAVKKRFPDAEIYADHKAISAIGKGMAYWAPDKIRAMDFEKAYTAFVERTEIDEDNDEVNIVNRALANAFLECVGGMSNDVVQEERDAVIFGVEQWRDYQCRSYDIPDKVESHMRDWCKQTGVPTFVSNIEKQIDELKKRLNRDFISCVLDPLKMGPEELLKSDDKVFLSDSQRILKNLFDKLTEFIVEYYKEHGIWSHFPNQNRGIFSNPRPDWLNANVDALNEWLNKESQATRNVCVELFCTHEFQVTDNFESTFLNLFITEGRFDLENLMKERVKAILGKLVLEEYLEDE